MMFTIKQAEFICQDLDVPLSDTNIEQMKTYLDAFAVFMERQETYQDLWKAAGSRDSARNLKSKAMRMEVLDTATHPEVCSDTGLDAINYAAFYTRNVRDGR